MSCNGLGSWTLTRKWLMDSDRLSLGHFLVSIEVFIVSTALVEIIDELQPFTSLWRIMNAYLSRSTRISRIVDGHRRLTALFCTCV